MEIFDESTLSEYEILRQRNIIKNYEFMKSCGLPVKPLIYVERKKLSIEEQYKYISEEEDEEEEDVDWTPQQEKKKKENKQNEMLNEFTTTKIRNPSKFFGFGKRKSDEQSADLVPQALFSKAAISCHGNSRQKTKPSTTKVRPPRPPTSTITRPQSEKNQVPLQNDDSSDKRTYPKRNIERCDYQEMIIPDSDHYLCKFRVILCKMR